MTAGLKPYPEMKDSGVEWLGPVPAHWEVMKLGRIGRLFKGNGASKEDEVPTGIPCVRYGDLYTRHSYFIHDTRACITEERANAYTPIKSGDVLFAASGETIDEIGKSAVNLIDGKAYCGGDVIIFRPKQRVDPQYMGYATDFQPAAIQKARMGRGFTIVHIYGDQLKGLTIPLPPVPEQAAIARFLEHADRRIQRYIRAKQKLIALLEEQEQALVRELVAGQIDVRTGLPFATYKTADTEWFAHVPTHWDRVRLKTLLRPVDHRSTTGEETLLSLRRDHGVVIYADHFKRPPQGATLVGFKRVKPGNLVVNRLQANNGLVFCSKLNGLVSPDYSVFEARRPLQMQYLSDLLRTEEYRTHFRQEARGLGTGTAGFLRLYDDALLRTVVHLPPLSEQHLILRTLNATQAQVNALTGNVQQELDLMKQFQACLVTNLVTGKLDVREAAANLPDDHSLAPGDKTGESHEAGCAPAVNHEEVLSELAG